MVDRYPGNEAINSERTLTDVVARKIVEIQPTESVDPYKVQIGRPVELPFDRAESPDGKIKFGKQYETRSLTFGLFEITYVDTKSAETNDPQIIVNKFHERGGLASRMCFKRTFSFVPGSIAESGIGKHYQLPPWARDHGGYVKRSLETEEQVTVLEILDDPVLHADRLEDLFVLSEPDEAALAANLNSAEEH